MLSSMGRHITAAPSTLEANMDDLIHPLWGTYIRCVDGPFAASLGGRMGYTIPSVSSCRYVMARFLLPGNTLVEAALLPGEYEILRNAEP